MCQGKALDHPPLQHLGAAQIIGDVWVGLVGWLVGGVVVAVAGNFSNQWWRALVDCYYGSSPKCFSEKRRSED